MNKELVLQLQIDVFNKNGYLLVENLLTVEEIKIHQNLYDDFLSNKINASRYVETWGVKPMVLLQIKLLNALPK